MRETDPKQRITDAVLQLLDELNRPSWFDRVLLRRQFCRATLDARIIQDLHTDDLAFVSEIGRRLGIVLPSETWRTVATVRDAVEAIYGYAPTEPGHQDGIGH